MSRRKRKGKTMKLRHVTGAHLTLDSGETVSLERLGAGMFHTCYVDRTAKQVYSITIEREQGSDYSKEILEFCEENPHLPPVERCGYIDGSDRRVYRMPLYEPLKAANRESWDLLKRLESARADAWRSIVAEQVTPRKMRIGDIGALVNRRVIEIMDAPGVPQSLKDALEELANTAANYGSGYVFEFSRRNVMVDGAGVLILLDTLFNLEAVEAMRRLKEKKARAF